MDAARDEPPTLEELARRYLDLWQDQWAATCSDPDMADTLARTVQGMGQSALLLNPFLSLQGAGMPGVRGGHDRDPAPTPGTPPAGPAHDGGDDRAAELTRRIALLEERIAALAAGAGGPGGGAGRKPGGKRPRKS